MMRRKWVKWVNLAAVGASLLFVVGFAFRSATDLQAVNWVGLLPYIGLGLLLYGLSLGAQGLVWIWIVADLTGMSWNAGDFVTYFQSQLVRRIPGAPWYIASRAAQYAGRGTSGPGAAVTASLLEWGGMLVTSTIWIVGGRWGWVWSVVLLVMIAVLAALLPCLCRSSRCPKRLVGLSKLSSGHLYSALGAYVSVWFVAALILWLLIRGIVPQARLAIGYVATVWASSAAVSMITVFAPAGLGVRELSLVAQLQPAVGVTMAALAALIVRLLFTVGDVVYYGLVSAVRYLLTRSSKLTRTEY